MVFWERVLLDGLGPLHEHDVHCYGFAQITNHGVVRGDQKKKGGLSVAGPLREVRGDRLGDLASSPLLRFGRFRAKLVEDSGEGGLPTSVYGCGPLPKAE